MSMHATVYSSGAALYQCGLIGSGVHLWLVLCNAVFEWYEEEVIGC